MSKVFSPMVAGAVAFMPCVLAGPATAAAWPGAQVLTSPDGRSSITIEGDASWFSMMRRGESVTAASPLGLDLDGEVGASDVLELHQASAEDAAIREPLKK